jgi:dihydroorotate dehydrogenase
MADLLFKLARPVLTFLDPERAHGVTIRALKLGFARTLQHQPDDPILATTVWNLSFPNPVGLAAGFDKHAEVCDAALALGFGFVEAGTVTPRPHPGIVGANVGKNRDTTDGAADYIACIEAVGALADYLVVNVSSPNTPGLRALQARAQIEELLARVQDSRRRNAAGVLPPLLVKVGPDLDEVEVRDIAEVALATGVDGLIIGNTTVARPPTLRSPDRNAPGGLSGKPLLAASTACLAAMYRFTEGRIPIIGCGGIASGADAYAKIRAGASLVQLYSALVFHGPGLVERIKRELAALLRRDGFASVRDAIGVDEK